MGDMQLKLRTNSPLKGAWENNLLPLQAIINNQNSEASANSADRTSLIALKTIQIV